jgi:hypothetical protein
MERGRRSRVVAGLPRVRKALRRDEMRVPDAGQARDYTRFARNL